MIVFGLGDSNYEHFNKFSIDFERKARELKANILIPTELTDASKNRTIEDFLVWSQRSIPVIKRSVVPLSASEYKKYKHTLETVNFQLSIVRNNKKSSCDNVSFWTTKYKACQKAKVVSIKEIRQVETLTDKTLLVQLKFEDSNQSFKLADNFAFYPKNSIAQINKTLSHFQVDAQSRIAFGKQTTKKQFPFPDNVKVKTLLKNYLDLHGPVTYYNKQS